MPIHIIDHTYGPWVSRKRQENGAATYSRDIMELVMPELFSFLDTKFGDRRVLISTAPPLTDVRREDLPARYHSPDIVLQWLHAYSYNSPYLPIHRLLAKFPDSKIVVVTAYEAYKLRLDTFDLFDSSELARLHVVYVPMFINTHWIEVNTLRCRQGSSPEKRILYFGNLYKAKSKEFRRVIAEIRSAGWTVDILSKGKLNYNGPTLTQEESWRLMQSYSYGIGVGRCALEMYTLGLRVLISGEHWGGLCLDQSDWATQVRTNFNGRVITGTRDLTEALDLLPHSFTKKGTTATGASQRLISAIIESLIIEKPQPWAAL
jgi:hypothetical protein